VLNQKVSIIDKETIRLIMAQFPTTKRIKLLKQMFQEVLHSLTYLLNKLFKIISLSILMMKQAQILILQENQVGHLYPLDSNGSNLRIRVCLRVGRPNDRMSRFTSVIMTRS
jgi:hypothetical protein